MMLFTGLIILSSCNNENGTGSKEITNNRDSVSYALGANFGTNVLRQVESAGDTSLNYDAMVVGFSEALKSKDLLIDDLTGTQIINEYMRTKDEERRSTEQEKFSDNMSLSDAFFEQNKNKEGVIETESGLQYEVVTLGEGEFPLDGDRVSVNYEGTTLNGEVFDSSYERGESMVFGINRVIQGWTEGLKLMPVGSKYIFYIPYELAYNDNPPPGTIIEPYGSLIFTVELIGIEK